jgi:hypothetical protein
MRGAGNEMRAILYAVLGNAGTMVSFRVGPEDAALLAKEFQPTFDVQNLLSLPNRRVHLKLMINRAPSAPFSAGMRLPLETRELL